MPKYNYKCDEVSCDSGTVELQHPISECDDPHFCVNGHLMHRVPAFKEAYFWGPDFACNSHVARANVGRNPNNQNSYSKC